MTIKYFVDREIGWYRATRRKARSEWHMLASILALDPFQVSQ